VTNSKWPPRWLHRCVVSCACPCCQARGGSFSVHERFKVKSCHRFIDINISSDCACMQCCVHGSAVLMSVCVHVRTARTCSISLRSPPSGLSSASQSLPRHSHRRTAARMSATKDSSSPGHCADSVLHSDIPVQGAAAGREGLAPWVPSAGVSIPRPDELRAKLEGFSLSDTHVVADFDFTLTRYWLDEHGGRKGLSSHLLVQRYAECPPCHHAGCVGCICVPMSCPCPFPSSRATVRVRANQHSCPLSPICMPINARE
jgi:hypothetical protein